MEFLNYLCCIGYINTHNVNMIEKIHQEHMPILRFVQQKISLSDAEIDFITASFVIVKKKKNEFILKYGHKADHLYFLSKGYVRVFHEDENGYETTSNILSVNDFVTSFESFTNQCPAKESIQCSSDCELLCISKQNYDLLYIHVSGWQVFCQSVYERYIIKSQQRTFILQNLSASDRYAKLLHTQPDIVLNTPVKHLATYLGIKPQSLSRIRKQI